MVDGVMKLVTQLVTQQHSSVLYLSDPDEEDKMTVDSVMKLVALQQHLSV